MSKSRDSLHLPRNQSVPKTATMSKAPRLSHRQKRCAGLLHTVNSSGLAAMANADERLDQTPVLDHKSTDFGEKPNNELHHNQKQGIKNQPATKPQPKPTQATKTSQPPNCKFTKKLSVNRRSYQKLAIQIQRSQRRKRQAIKKTRWSPRTRMQTRSKSYICPNDTLVGHSCGSLV